jgi:hypothetical protein
VRISAPRRQGDRSTSHRLKNGGTMQAESLPALSSQVVELLKGAKRVK